MQLTDKICFSKLLFMQQHPYWAASINKCSYTRPQVEYEGVAGYIETTITLDIKCLEAFMMVERDWWKLDHDERMKYRRIALGVK